MAAGSTRCSAGWSTWCVTWRKTTIAVTALAFVAAMAAFSLVQKQFFPTANRPELIVDMRLAQGASYAATDSEVQQAREVAGARTPTSSIYTPMSAPAARASTCRPYPSSPTPTSASSSS